MGLVVQRQTEASSSRWVMHSRLQLKLVAHTVSGAVGTRMAQPSALRLQSTSLQLVPTVFLTLSDMLMTIAGQGIVRMISAVMDAQIVLLQPSTLQSRAWEVLWSRACTPRPWKYHAAQVLTEWWEMVLVKKKLDSRAARLLIATLGAMPSALMEAASAPTPAA